MLGITVLILLNLQNPEECREQGKTKLFHQSAFKHSLTFHSQTHTNRHKKVPLLALQQPKAHSVASLCHQLWTSYTTTSSQSQTLSNMCITKPYQSYKLSTRAPYIYNARCHAHPYIPSTTVLSDTLSNTTCHHILPVSYHIQCVYTPPHGKYVYTYMLH